MTQPIPASGSADTAATVLLIDDEPNILSSLRRLLRTRGYRVLTAESGQLGLEILGREAVNLVICDMRMPEMDGARVLAEARARWPDTVRILLTGYADIQSIQEAINRGEIFRYVTKPWDDQELVLLVRDGLERRQLEQDKQRLEALTARQNEELRALNLSLEAKVEARTAQIKVEHASAVAANTRLKQNFVTTIKILSSMNELRPHSKPGNARLVASLARRIAVALALPAPDVQDVFIAGLLHDIGKIGLSETILATPLTSLHGESLGLFRKHPVRAADLLMPLEELRGSAAILRSQLERFDGTGFPNGTIGLAIPLGARILALAADFYNLQHGAMVQRHLRPDEAKSLIIGASGTRYDPNVVAAFRQIIAGPVGADSAGTELLSGELVPGMVLARDLVSRDGLMLLSVDHVLNARMIEQVQDFEEKSGRRLTIWVHSPREGHE